MNKNISESLEVNSEAINGVTYYYTIEKLIVQFTSGHKYEYSKVPKHVYLGIRDANSKGGFLHKYVFGRYEFKRMK
jgi:hypothetical protein